MKNFLKIFILIFIVIIIVINYLSNVHITVVFKDLRPFEGKIPVYYKGLMIGKATDRFHSKDSQHTNVKITLYDKGLRLPLNTRAVLKKRIKNDKEYDYLELIYPLVPSERFIEENSHIHGSATVDVKEYLKNQTPEDLDKIKTNLMSASENLNSSLDAIFGLFVLIQDVLQENRANLKGSSHNLKETSANINRATKKIDNIIIEKQWNNTFDNIENSTGGLHGFTGRINGIADNINLSAPNFSSVLENTKCTMENINSISCGIRQTLSKNFGGLRLFFGRVIKEK